MRYDGGIKKMGGGLYDRFLKIHGRFRLPYNSKS